MSLFLTNESYSVVIYASKDIANLSSYNFFEKEHKNMATAITGILISYEGVSSEAAIFGTETGGTSTIVCCNINKDVEIHINELDASAIVRRPFVIGLTRTEDGYMASSRISNAYELGVTPYQAIRSYLEFLVDELIWLRKNEENLSASIHEELYLLQGYLRIV